MCLYPTKPFQYATRPASCSTAFGPLKYSSSTAVTGLIEEGIFRVVAFSNVDGDAPLSSRCLSINTIFTLMKSGVGVIVAVAVADGVKVEVNDGLRVGVLLAVIVGEDVADGVNDFVAAGTLVNVNVDVNTGTFVVVVDGVKVGVLVGAVVEVLLGVDVSVSEGAAVCVEDGATV